MPDFTRPDFTRSELIKLLSPAPSYFCQIETKPQKLVRLAGVNLAGLDLSYMDLSYIDFADAILDGCYMHKAQLRGSMFWRTKMRKCDLSNTVAEEGPRQTCFHGADLSDSLLNGVNWTCIEASDAIMRNVAFTNASLIGSVFPGVVFDGASFLNSDVRDCQFNPKTSWKGVTVKGGNWTGVHRFGGEAPYHLKLPFKAPGYDPKFTPKE